MAQETLNWRLDELAHAGPEHLDPGYVAAYEQKSPTDWSVDISTLRRLGIGPKSTVVDLGAGTGSFASTIAPHVARVVAVDISMAMVEAARVRGIEAARAGFLTYEHEGDPPDAVLTATPFIICRTSGRRSLWNASRGCSGLAGFSCSKTSSTRSIRRMP